MVVDASCSLNLKCQLQFKCRSARPYRQRNDHSTLNILITLSTLLSFLQSQTVLCFLFSKNRTSHIFKCYSFTSDVFIKVTKRPRKGKRSLLLEVSRIQTHCFCHSVNRKVLVLVTNLGNVPQFLFPLKNINFFDSRLSSCVLDLYLLIGI